MSKLVAFAAIQGAYNIVAKAEGKYKCTIHAGEVTSPNQIWVAIKELGAARIGSLSQEMVSARAALRLHGANFRTPGSQRKKFAMWRRKRGIGSEESSTPCTSASSFAASAIV